MSGSSRAKAGSFVVRNVTALGMRKTADDAVVLGLQTWYANEMGVRSRWLGSIASTLRLAELQYGSGFQDN